MSPELGPEGPAQLLPAEAGEIAERALAELGGHEKFDRGEVGGST